MLTLVVAIKSVTPCEPELFLFAGMNDHLHSAGLLEPLRSGDPMIASMNEIQELVASVCACDVGHDCGRLLATYVDGCSQPRIRASELEFSEVRNGSGFGRMCLMP